MFCSNIYNNTLNAIYLNLLKKKLFIIIPITKKNKELLKILTKVGLINGFKYYNNSYNYAKVYLRYVNNEPVWRYIRFYYKLSKKKHVKYKKLVKYFKYDYSTTLILFTSKGIMLHSDAIKNKIGGIVFCLLL
uniref:Ribosomal protein S8 n=1 Tax=Gruberia lanceolata TaxID=1978530 RepID=A0A6C0UAC3_9CILI|nr:ribosomal protein S8 [Gruberia lanceolata]